jgi:UDP-N-acetylmuramoyl-tripeptide--D-alanyl-D-alanine ligase
MTNVLHGIRLSDLARAADGKLIGEDAEITSFTTDSRQVANGDVYFCLSGERFDGHDYAQSAAAAGAMAVVCERPVDCGVAEILVPNTRKAYGMLAQLWRNQLDVKLLGVTGSNGKTTVKQLLTGICAAAGCVHSTRANDNNDIGVPHTLLGIDATHQFAVVEMGANQLGEIAWLGSLAQPDVAIITNVSASHLEGFGSIDSVYREKSDIYNSLREGGTAIINRDDAFAADWLALNAQRAVITFGSDDSADVWAEAASGDELNLHCRLDGHVSSMPANCQLVGRHNLMNIAAAVAAGLAAGIELSVIAAGIANVAPVAGRLNFHHLADGVTIIDDTYNANPASARAAIDVLASRNAERWLVLGDLKELGDDAAAHHTRVGEYALEGQVDRLFAIGELCQATVAAFGANGEWFDDKQQLMDRLVSMLDSRRQSADLNTTVLVKGSRSMAMEKVVNDLRERYAEGRVEGCVEGRAEFSAEDRAVGGLG